MVALLGLPAQRCSSFPMPPTSMSLGCCGLCSAGRCGLCFPACSLLSVRALLSVRVLLFFWSASVLLSASMLLCELSCYWCPSGLILLLSLACVRYAVLPVAGSLARLELPCLLWIQNC